MLLQIEINSWSTYVDVAYLNLHKRFSRDDTHLLFVSSYQNISENRLIRDLENIHNWFHIAKVSFKASN